MLWPYLLLVLAGVAQTGRRAARGFASHHLAVALTCGITMLACAGAAAAQSPQRVTLDAGVVVLAADHDLLGDPLVGAGVRYSRSIRGELTARVGVERLGGSARRTGIPCAGLVFPGTCAAEPLRDEARLTTALAGLAYRLPVWPRLTVALTGDLRLGRVRADTRGLTSGATLSAEKWVWGGDVGAGMAWAPSDGVPLALEVDVTAGSLRPTATEMVVDGYTPFERGFGARRLRVGIAWRPGAARRATSDATPRG